MPKSKSNTKLQKRLGNKENPIPGIPGAAAPLGKLYRGVRGAGASVGKPMFFLTGRV